MMTLLEMLQYLELIIVHHLKGDIHDFSVYYDAIDKSDILDIHKRLMKKDNIK